MLRFRFVAPCCALLVTMACGSSGDSPASDVGPGVGGAAGPSDGTGGASDGTGGGGGDPDAMPTPDCELFETPVTGGPRGLLLLHTKSSSDPFFGGTRVFQADEDGVIFSEDGVIQRIPLDGGAIVELAAEPEGTINPAEGQLLIQESSTINEGMVDQWLAPFDDPDNRTQIASYVGTLRYEVGGGYVFWEVREPARGIWAAAIPDGEPFEIVPGGTPGSLIAHEGYLYWENFETKGFERVPVAGGASEQLYEFFAPGAPHFTDNAFYWISGSGVFGGPASLHRTAPIVAGTDEIIFEGQEDYEVMSARPVPDGVYFSVGELYGCSHLYFAAGPNDPEIILGGFDGGTSVLAVTSDYLIVSDETAIYRLDR